MNTRTGSFSLVLGAIVAFGSGSALAQTWSSTSDFQEGVFLNLNATTVSDQLQW